MKDFETCVFSWELYYFLKRNNVSSLELSKKINATPQTINKWLNGETFPNSYSRDQLEAIGFEVYKYTDIDFKKWILEQYNNGLPISDIALLL